MLESNVRSRKFFAGVVVVKPCSHCRSRDLLKNITFVFFIVCLDIMTFLIVRLIDLFGCSTRYFLYNFLELVNQLQLHFLTN